MKATTTLMSLCAISILASASIQAQGKMDEKELKHVVLIKFKDSATNEQITAACDAFGALKDAIPLIQHFEWGENNSPEGLNQELTHCFVATFHSDEDRDAYLIHPAHKTFVEEQGPKFDKVTVVDYWVKE